MNPEKAKRIEERAMRFGKTRGNSTAGTRNIGAVRRGRSKLGRLPAVSSPWRGLQGGTGQLPKAGPAQASETAGSDAPPIFEQIAPSELLDRWRNRRQLNSLSGRRSTSPPRT